MKGVFNISVLLLGLIVTACVNEPKCQDNVRVITVDVTKQADISEFVSSFDGYICLETPDDCLISDINKLKSVGDTIYISDDSKIAMFSRKDGSLLGKIQKQGRGPGEYIKLTNFDVFDSQIYVLSSIDENIIVYDFLGHVLKTIELGEGYRDLSVIDEDNIWLYSSDSNDSMYNFILIDSAGKTKSEYDPFSENQSFILTDYVFCNKSSDTLFTAQYYDNIVYSLHRDGYNSAYKFDMNLKDMIPQETLSAMRIKDLHNTYKYNETLNRVVRIDENEDALFAETLCFLTGKALRICFIKANIDTGISCFYVKGEEIDDRFPLFDLSRPVCYDGKTMISYIEASDAKRYRKEFKLDYFSDISEYDNPVIVFHTLNY
ncbi:MAG: 6-bladed beta-propeller [Bacteroidales bacterium]|nr:6-bladed beta-propeller [Bacteroidales bacterium]